MDTHPRRQYFKILAPFTRIEDVKLLKDAGADELYCGYVTEDLTKRWPLAFNILNRRGEGQSFENYKDFRKAVIAAEEYHLPVYVTLNGLYTPPQYPFLLELVRRMEYLNAIKGLIIADMGLLLTLRKNNFKKEIHMGTGGTVFNSMTADFYHNLGADRVILDRQLTVYEIADIISGLKTDVDVEIFIINEGCGGFIDGFCTFFHCFENGDSTSEEIDTGLFLKRSYNTEQTSKGCNFYSEGIKRGNFKILDALSHRGRKVRLRFHPDKHRLTGCRICELYQLHQYPIKCLKIIGRGPYTKQTVKLVEFVSKALSWLSGGISKKEYRKRCKNIFSKIYFGNERRCTKFDCYFSSHWVKDEI